MVVYCRNCDQPNMDLPIEGMFCSSGCEYSYNKTQEQKQKKKNEETYLSNERKYPRNESRYSRNKK